MQRKIKHKRSAFGSVASFPDIRAHRPERHACVCKGQWHRWFMFSSLDIWGWSDSKSLSVLGTNAPRELFSQRLVIREGSSPDAGPWPPTFYSLSIIYYPYNGPWDRMISKHFPGFPMFCESISSVQFSHSVMSDSLLPHGLQHTRPPCPSPTPGVHPNSCSLSWWYHLAISSCHPLLPPSIFPSIRVFSNESVLHTRWPKYWSFSFNISPSNKHSGLISFRMDWLAI